MQVSHETVFDIHLVTNPQEIPPLKISDEFLHFPEFYNKMLLNEIVSEIKYVLVVATKNSEVIGFINAVSGMESTYINEVCVSENFYRHGIGTAMLSALNMFAPMKQMVLDCTSTNKSAIKFYEANGFNVAFITYGAYSHAREEVNRVTMVKAGNSLVGQEGPAGVE